MRKEAESLIRNLGSMSLSDIKRGLSGLNPPFPDELLGALAEDGRAGAQRLLRTLQSRQRAGERAKTHLAKMLRHERRAWSDGFKVVAGVDEAGRGPLAGPVVASAVILSPELRTADINDSKSLSDIQRRKVLPIIAAAADIGIGVVGNEEIDRRNIYQANLLAMRLAIEDLDHVPDLILIDGRPVKGLEIGHRAIIKGDRLSLSIAAASIVAKVTRDQMMLEFGKIYPQYNFARNKGYGTREHLDSIKKHGVSPIHRRSFAPVRECLRNK